MSQEQDEAVERSLFDRPRTGNQLGDGGGHLAEAGRGDQDVSADLKGFV